MALTVRRFTVTQWSQFTLILPVEKCDAIPIVVCVLRCCINSYIGLTNKIEALANRIEALVYSVMFRMIEPGSIWKKPVHQDEIF